MSILRNDHVAVSNLMVQTHAGGRVSVCVCGGGGEYSINKKNWN